MWKKLALAVAVVVATLAVVVAMQPASFSVERSISIAAPAEAIYGHIQSLRSMDAWSPFAHMDPKLQIAYSGPASGPGARSEFDGPRMGKGRLTITGATPPREVELQLEMLAPIEATNRVLFRLDPAGDATRVTWRMEGRNGFVGKAMGLVTDVDAMLGGQFEQGLASLKALAEADAAGGRAADGVHDAGG